jgi:hypothetical protein
VKEFTESDPTVGEGRTIESLYRLIGIIDLKVALPR